MWKKVKLLNMSNFTFFHNVFHAVYILKSFDSHILVVVCSFFEFGTVSKWCIWEWDSWLSFSFLTGESRGVGGIFFDDFDEGGPDHAFDFVSVSLYLI